MVIKLNYKWIFIYMGFFLITALILLEIFFPNTVLTQSIDKMDSNDNSANIDSANIKKETVRLPVIMYHNMLKDTSKCGDYVISPAQFENDLKYIKKSGYETVTAAEIIAFLRGDGALPPRPILITFDDGNETIFSYAFPLLEKYEMTAIINIIGKHTDIFTKEPLPHHLSYSHVNWDELRQMNDSKVFEIGNHSYDMHGNHDAERYGIGHKKGEDEYTYQAAIRKDIGGLNTQMEAELSAKPTVFAYPFGSIPKESLAVLNELGFELLLTCEEKVNTLESGSELPQKLKRFNRSGFYSTQEFFAKLEK